MTTTSHGATPGTTRYYLGRLRSDYHRFNRTLFDWIASGGSAHVRLFWTAVGVVILVVGAVTFSANNYVDDSERIVVGRSAVVVLGVPGDDLAFNAVARFDTGADRSSIDASLVDQLGLDLTDASTIRVGSALGAEERPLVDITVAFAGTTRTVTVSVADRSGQSNEVLLGVDALDGFVVDPSQELTTDASGPDPTVVNATDGITSGEAPVAMLLLFPLAAAIVVALRMLLGMQPLGTFAPVLLALALSQGGATFALLGGAALVATFLVQPLIVRLKVPRQARLAILIGVVVMLWNFLPIGASFGLSNARTVPVIVTVVVLDRLWIVITDDGMKAAFNITLQTAVVTALLLLVLSSSVIQALALEHPYVMGTVGVLLAGLSGSYRGLRLSEFVRFRRRSSFHVAPVKPEVEDPSQYEVAIGSDDGSPFRTSARHDSTDELVGARQ